MTFAETRTPFGPYTKISVRHQETGNEITIIPEMGARLNNFQVNLHGDSTDIIDGYFDAHALSLSSLAKNALLAPWPNRVAGGCYQYSGQDFQLDINRPHENNAIHGFAVDALFTVEQSAVVDDYYELVLQGDVAPETGYPFPFSMVVKYRFGGTWLEVDTELCNMGDTTMPVGFGWRPHFRTTGTIDQLRLTLPRVERLVVDEFHIPTGEKETYDTFSAAHPMGATAFDTNFHMLDKDSEIQLYDEEIGLYITVTFPSFDTPYEYVQVYTPSSRESIAIEPMTCAVNAFNNGWGLKKIAPGKSLCSHFTILVS